MSKQSTAVLEAPDRPDRERSPGVVRQRDPGRENVIETRGLTKTYAGRTAVSQLDLIVRRGEVYGFLGPNGAGKTTTMRMLLGLIAPTSGSATVMGRAPGDPDGLARVGALIEEAASYPYLTARDNLRIAAAYCDVSADRIATVLEQVKLTGREDDKVKTYSLGMRQRLGLALALLKEPELIILDEPTNGLDPQGMAEMRDLMRGLAMEGRTVLVSSHLLAEVEQICDRVGIIRAGRLVGEGTVDDLRGRSHLLVRATPLDIARHVVAGIVGADNVDAAPADADRHGQGHLDGLAVDADPDEAPHITKALVDAGVAVHEVRCVERSLEAAFFQLINDTGEESS